MGGVSENKKQKETKEGNSNIRIFRYFKNDNCFYNRTEEQLCVKWNHLHVEEWLPVQGSMLPACIHLEGGGSRARLCHAVFSVSEHGEHPFSRLEDVFPALVSLCTPPPSPSPSPHMCSAHRQWETGPESLKHLRTVWWCLTTVQAGQEGLKGARPCLTARGRRDIAPHWWHHSS